MRAIREDETGMPIDNAKIGSRIKRYRTNKQLTQEQLSEVIHSSTATITAIERGVKAPSIEMLVCIANALEVSADDILVDALSFSGSSAGNEIQEILLDCNNKETIIIIRALKFLKALLSEVGV